MAYIQKVKEGRRGEERQIPGSGVGKETHTPRKVGDSIHTHTSMGLETPWGDRKDTHTSRRWKRELHSYQDVKGDTCTHTYPEGCERHTR